MVEDIVPSLLKKIKSEFEGARLDSEVLKDLLSKLHHSKASYLDANQYAIEIGEILSKVLGASLTNETLPDGKMYYNIAQRVLTDVLGRNYELVSDYTEQIQKNLNSDAKIGLAVQVPELNQDRIDGLVNRLASEESFDDVRWLLEEPVVNFTQSIIDDSIQKNAEFQHKSGLQPEIVRKSAYHCCEWCQEVQGIYKYPRVPKDIYRRHQRCRCTVDYDPKSGKVQNVWTKKWSKEDSNSRKEERIKLQKQYSEKNIEKKNLNLKNRQLLHYKNEAIDAIKKTNMPQKVGTENYKKFIDIFDTIKDENTLKLYQKLGSKIEYEKLGKTGNFAEKNRVQLNQSAFDGKVVKTLNKYWAKPMSTTFHENGHALDYLGLQAITKGKKVVIGEKKVRLFGETTKVSVYATHSSHLPQYNLRETIREDLWRRINGDLPMIKELGENPKQSEKNKIIKIAKENQKKFQEEMKELFKENPSAVANLSDMVEATGWYKEPQPFGYGHGKNYWKKPGSAEAEFFAEISELIAVDPEGYRVVKEILPNAVNVYHKIVNDILKGV